jgi:hypothetical protein
MTWQENLCQKDRQFRGIQFCLELLALWPLMVRKFLITKQSTFGRLIPLRGTLQEVGLASTVPGQVFHEWVRQSDGRLSYIGFTKLLHGVTVRAAARTNR